MIHSLADFCFLLFFLAGLASPFTPVFLMWRLAGIAALAYTTAQLIYGPVHWTDQNLPYFFGLMIIIGFCCVIILAIIIRLVILATSKSLSVDTLIGPKHPSMRQFDIAALTAIGCLAGLALAIFLAFRLSGATLGVNFDLILAGLSAAVAVIALAISRKKVSIVITATFATLALSAFMGSRQAQDILTTAETLADGRAWCLSTASLSEPITELQQLGFFALSKGVSSPHLVLVIRENEQTAPAAHWSIRRQEFHQNTSVSYRISACRPVDDFTEALTNGTIDSDTYGVGSKVYSITPDLHPRAFTDRISIRSDILTGPNSAHPSSNERIELIYNPRKPYAPDDAIPIAMMPDPKQLNPDNLTGGNNLIIAGFDELTGQNLILRCLYGANANRFCFAKVHDGALAYTFYLPLRDITEWRDATARVKALFKALQVDEHERATSRE